METGLLLLSSAVVAAIVTAIINIVKTLIDNKAKTNDSIRLFKYTKLYEILCDQQSKNDSYVGDRWWIEIFRNKTLQQSYTLAKPLVDQKYWCDIDDAFEAIKMIKIEQIETTLNVSKGILAATELDHIQLRLIRANGKIEELFETAVHNQMKQLLHKK